MAVRKIRKGNVTLPVNDPSIPTIPYAGRYSLVVDQDGSLSWEAKAGSPSVTSLLNDTLVSLDVDDALSQVRANAVYGKEKLQSIDLPLINGPIGDYAFSGLLSLSHMSFDKWSDVTSLGVGCFTGIGVNRNSAERFVFDFRNSSFKRFTGFASTSREPSYDSQGEEVAPGVQGYGLWNTTIHLPPTVDELGDTDYSHSGVDRAVLDGSENVDLYVSSATPPQLYSTAQLPKDEASHIMVLYKYMSRYRYATN